MGHMGRTQNLKRAKHRKIGFNTGGSYYELDDDHSTTLHVCRAGSAEPDCDGKRVCKTDLNWLLPALEVLESPVSLILDAYLKLPARKKMVNLPQVLILRA
jgi:hypothetical protein